MCSPVTLSQISLIKLSISAPQNILFMLNQFQNFMSASSTPVFIPEFFVRDIGGPSLNRIKGCTVCRAVCLHSVHQDYLPTNQILIRYLYSIKQLLQLSVMLETFSNWEQLAEVHLISSLQGTNCKHLAYITSMSPYETFQKSLQFPLHAPMYTKAFLQHQISCELMNE